MKSIFNMLLNQGIMIFLFLNFSLHAGELNDNQNIVDIYYDHSMGTIDIAPKDRFFIQPNFTVISNLLDLKDREIQSTPCIESEGGESCPLQSQKCNVNIQYSAGESTPVYKTITNRKICKHGVYSDSLAQCVTASKCSVGLNSISTATGIAICYNDYYLSNGDINPNPHNIEEPYCEISSMHLNNEKTLCLENKVCPSGYIEENDICRLNYHYFQYSCPDEGSLKPRVQGEDCQGMCPDGVQNNCACNDEHPPSNNCKIINGECPIDNTIPCVATPSENGEYELDSESYIYKPLIKRSVFGGFNAASINSDTGICLNSPCPYVVKHITADGSKLYFSELRESDNLQYVSVEGNRFDGEINGDIAYIVIGDSHQSLKGYDNDGNLLGTIHSVYRMDGKVGFIDSIGFNVISTEVPSNNINAIKNTLYFYNTFTDQHHNQGFITFVNEMDSALADCVENDREIEQACEIGTFNNSGLCQKVIDNSFCSGSYELDNSSSVNPICKDAKQCIFGDYVNKQDEQTRLCSALRIIEETCPNGETLDAQGRCTYIQNKCRDDYEYLQEDDTCQKTITASPIPCKEGYELVNVSENSNIGECRAIQSCSEGTFSENISENTRNCIVDSTHDEVCPSGEILMERDGISYCSYSKNVCEDGYIYDSSNHICKRVLQENPVNMCSDSSDIFIDNGDGTGKCIEQTTCSGGYWVENIDSTKRKCYIDNLYNEECPAGSTLNSEGVCQYKQNKCTSPYVYSSASNMCEKTVTQNINTLCSTDYSFVDVPSSDIARCEENNVCQNGNWIENKTTTSKICRVDRSYSENKPVGQQINMSDGRFYADKDLCAVGTVYNDNTGLCETDVEYICTKQGYAYNASTNKCESDVACADGMTYNAVSNKCEKPSIIVCAVEGYSWNNNSKRCEANPVCESGFIYDSNTKKCVEFKDGQSIEHIGSVRDFAGTGISYFSSSDDNQEAEFYAGRSYSDGYTTCNSGKYSDMATWFKDALSDLDASFLRIGNPSNCNYYATFNLNPQNDDTKICKLVEMRRYSVSTSHSNAYGDNTCVSNAYSQMNGWFTDKYDGFCVGVSNPSNCNYTGTMVVYGVECTDRCPVGYDSDSDSKCFKDVSFPYYEYTCPSGYSSQNTGVVSFTKSDADENSVNDVELSASVNSNTPPPKICKQEKNPICNASLEHPSSFDSVNNVCYIPESNVCSSGGTLSSDGTKCEEPPVCGGSNFDAQRDICYESAVAQCSNGSTLSGGKCVFPRNDCSDMMYHNALIIGNNTLRCSEALSSVCSSPQANFTNASETQRNCEWIEDIVENCPNGETLNSLGKCVYNINKCPSDYFYNANNNICEKTIQESIIDSCRLGFDFLNTQSLDYGYCQDNKICTNNQSDTFVKNIDSVTRQCLTRNERIETCEEGRVLNAEGKCVKDENLCDQRIGIGYQWEIANSGSGKCEKILSSPPALSCTDEYNITGAISNNGEATCVEDVSCASGSFVSAVNSTTKKCLVQTDVHETCPEGETLDNNGRCIFSQSECIVDYNYFSADNQCKKFIYENPLESCNKSAYTFVDLNNTNAKCIAPESCSVGIFEKNKDTITRICKDLSFHAEVCSAGQQMDENGHCYYFMEDANCPIDYSQKLIDNKIVCVENTKCIDAEGNIGRLVKNIDNKTRLCHFDGSYGHCRGDWNYENVEPYDVLLDGRNNVGIVVEKEGHTFIATTDRVTREQCQDIATIYNSAISSLSSLSTENLNGLRESISYKYDFINSFDEAFCKKGRYDADENKCLYCDNGEVFSGTSCLSCPVTDELKLYSDFGQNIYGNEYNNTIVKTVLISLDHNITFCKKYSDGGNRSSVSWSCVKGGEPLMNDFKGDVDSNDILDYKISISGSGIPANKIHFCKRYMDHNKRNKGVWKCVNGDEPLINNFVGDVDKNDDLDYKITIDGIDNSNINFCKRYANNNGRNNTSWDCVHGNEPLMNDFVGDVDRYDDLDYKISISKSAYEYSPYGCFHKPLSGFYDYFANVNNIQSNVISNGNFVFDVSNNIPLTSVQCNSNISALDINCSIDNNGTNFKIFAVNNGFLQIMKVNINYLKNGNILMKSYPYINGSFIQNTTDEKGLQVVNYSFEPIDTFEEDSIRKRDANSESPEYGKSYCVIESPKNIGFESTLNAKKKINSTKFDYTCSPFLCSSKQCGIASCPDGYNGQINGEDTNDSVICDAEQCDINKAFSKKCGLSRGCPSDDATIIEDNNGVCFKMSCDESHGFTLNSSEKTCDKMVCPDEFPTDNGDGTCSP